MSDSPERLSSHLRERVAALHKREADPPHTPLDAAAQRRVVHSLVAEAARLRRSRERRGRLVVGAGAVLLMAAGVLLYLRGPAQEPEPAASADRSHRRQVPACQLPVLAVGERDPQAGGTIELGALGSLVMQPRSELTVERSGPCELGLRLTTGTLAGDLHSLSPARILIRTPHGAVIVTGTRFSVNSGSELEVLLESGVVDVQLREAGALRLQPGTRLRKGSGAQTLKRQRLTQADEQRLARWLEPPARSAQPAPSDSEPDAVDQRAHRSAFASSGEALKAAEAARRSQRWAAAREAYQAASQGRDGGAEVALLRWARFELDQAAASTTLRLLAEHKRRFTGGSLGAEAGWLEVQARQALGQHTRAQRAAHALLKRHPGTPQAAAAGKLLERE